MEVINGCKGDLLRWMEPEKSRAPVSKVDNLLSILWLYISDLQHNHDDQGFVSLIHLRQT